MSEEASLRLGLFTGIFLLMIVWEGLWPRRMLTTPKRARWVGNMGITLLNTAGLRLFFPLLAVDVAALAQERGWGLLSTLQLSHAWSFLLGVLVLDFIVYLQHVMFHTIPLFWRLHMVHHADLDVDATTGLRFHPIEVFLSMALKMAVVVVLGPSPEAVLFFEVALNATSLFNHGNVRLSPGIDKVLRLLVVTPDMHRVHHSVTIRETNSNFGFNFPWWDRILGTYRDQPAAGHTNMVIGLSQFRDPRRLSLPWMLFLPFVGDPGSYAINRRGGEPIKRS